ARLCRRTGAGRTVRRVLVDTGRADPHADPAWDGTVPGAGTDDAGDVNRQPDGSHAVRVNSWRCVYRTAPHRSTASQTSSARRARCTPRAALNASRWLKAARETQTK